MKKVTLIDEEGDFNEEEGDFNEEEGDFNEEEGDFNEEEGDFNEEIVELQPRRQLSGFHLNIEVCLLYIGTSDVASFLDSFRTWMG